MINSEKDINTIAGELIAPYKDNPMIAGKIFYTYQYGINCMKNRVNEYLKNKAVLSSGEIAEMFEALSNSIDSMSTGNITDAYNKVKTAQDIICRYLK